MNIKKQLNFWQIWNLTFGFFGIQFGWALQMANTSAIYEYLGANPEQIPMLWLAAPLSGLIANPLIGYFSDRTWTKLGRRKPYFLVGAILASIALMLMPNSSALWMAAGLLWILDTSINVTIEPFRAFLTDSLNEKQRTEGFAMQSFFVGFGAVIASLLPWWLDNIFHFETNNNAIPLTVKFSFYTGAAIFLFSVVWTVFMTEEYPPEKPIINQEHQGLEEIFQILKNMPLTMKQLAGVQFFTWLGMFAVFLYFPTAVAHQIFGAIDEHSALYTEGIQWAGICIAVYNCVCFLFSWFLPKIVAIVGKKLTHSYCLFIGGMGLISLFFVQNQYLMLLPMACFGIAWASILAMPYAILTPCLPRQNIGVYMGIFNAFIVIPQIIAALGLGWVMNTFLDNNRLLAVILGGFSFIIASLLVNIVNDITEEKFVNYGSIRISDI